MHPARRLLLVLSLLAVGLDPGPSEGQPASDPFVHLPWKAEGVRYRAAMGRSLAPAGDVNGDGYGDVIVSAIGDSITMPGQGRVYLYLGSPAGLSTVAAWTYVGEQAGSGLGNAVAPAGDVNGDGYGDVILGYDGFDTGGVLDAGKALVFHGGPGGLSPTPNRTLLPQVNQVEQFFGAAVATAGDIDRDGYDDVIVGAPGFTDAGSVVRGAAYVYRGGPAGLPLSPSHTLLGRPQQGWFGSAVSTAGDMDADGYADVIVGAPGETVGFVRSGAFSLYRGSAGGLLVAPDTTIGGANAESNLGASLAYLGDQSRDGYADILVGEPGANVNQYVQLGIVRRYYGGPGGITSLDATVSNNVVNYERFGTKVATMGDLDGDGYADFAAVGEGKPAGGGRVLVLLSDGGEGYYYGAVAPTSPDGGAIGTSIATSGDVNGDGRSEILIGDQLANVGNIQYAGRATMLELPRTMPRAATGWPRLGPEPGSRFGNAVAIVSGFPFRNSPALLIGDPGFQGTGRLSAHLSFRGGLDGTASWSDVGDGSYLSFGSRVVDAGDVNRDGIPDVVVSMPTADPLMVAPSPPAIGGEAAPAAPYQIGRIDLYLGGVSAPVRWQAVLAGGRDFDRVGTALGGRGDVNGDGYGDVVVGAEGWDSATLGGCGKAWVLYGAPNGFDGSWSVEGESYGRGLGASVALGDLDADGYSDVIVGLVAADGIPGDGRVQVYYGGPGGPSSTPGLVLYGYPSTPSFGRTVAALGDVTGDGICDLGVGAPLEDGVGRVYVFAGTRGRSQQNFAIWTRRGAQTGGRFGEAIAGGGDLDGDGIADIAIGAPFWDAQQVDEGRVEVYRGAPLVPESVPAMTLGSGIVGAQMGGSIAPLSDLNEDGFADLAIGAPGAAGRVYAYFGAGGAGFTARLHVYDVEQGELLRRRPGPNRLGLTNQVWPRVELATAGGRGRVQVEYEIKLQNEPFTGVPTFRDPTLYDAYDNVGGNSSEYGVPLPYPGRGYHLRSRIVRRSPYFPRSRWITPDAQVTGSLDFWTSGAVVDVAPGDAPAVTVPRIARIAPNPGGTRVADTRVDFVLPAAGPVSLDLYDVRGAVVRRLRVDAAAAGPGSATWDGRDAAGRAVPAGIYFVELRAGGRSDRAKLVRLAR